MAKLKARWSAYLVDDLQSYEESLKGKGSAADPVVDRRAKAVAAIDGALAQLEASAEPSKMSPYKFAPNGYAIVKVKLGRKLVMLDGFHPEKRYHRIEAKKVDGGAVKAFYEAVKVSIEDGSLDAELAEAAGDAAPAKKRGGRRSKALNEAVQARR